MDLNCTEDVISTGTKDTSSIIAPAATQAITSPAPPETLVNTLCRMSSGASVIIDSDHNGVETESSRRKLVSSRFKGVVPQPNGRWGAQIYERHQRVWLGTFNRQDDAARVYDVAAQRFRGRDAVTNFKPLGTDSVEYSFLVRHSKAEIVDMLRKHTYTEELEQSKRHSASNINKRDPVGSGSGPPQEQLFKKTVTPSDVGKLNRLVIPKQHAEKHFPSQRVSPASSKGLLLNFEDAGGKVWRFRYSYWNSSQSYVLTKGWSRFVKEKNLHAGDVVSFCKSSGQLYIDFMSRAELLALNATQLRSDNNAVRLFGVDIGKSSSNSKLYNKEMELFGFGSCKRRRRLL